MTAKEPKIKASIIIRPCYKDGIVSDSGRYIGEIYVNNRRIYQSIDTDTESSAYNNCAKHAQRYEAKYKSNFWIDANMNRLKNQH